MHLISQSEFARMAGMDRSYINRKINEGVIPSYGKNRQVNPEEAKAALAAAADPSRDAQREANARRRQEGKAKTEFDRTMQVLKHNAQPLTMEDFIFTGSEDFTPDEFAADLEKINECNRTLLDAASEIRQRLTHNPAAAHTAVIVLAGYSMDIEDVADFYGAELTPDKRGDRRE